MKNKILAAIVAPSLALGLPLTAHFEGLRLKPYYDSVGVRTVCYGETENIEEREYSKKECDEIFKARYGFFSFETARLYNETGRSFANSEIHAAMTDMSYNVGIATFKKSTMLRRLNEGRPVEACAAILLYTKAGGKDCRVKSNNCYGVWARRLKVHELCMRGARKHVQ